MKKDFDKLVEMALEPGIKGGRAISKTKETPVKDFHIALFLDLFDSSIPKQEWVPSTREWLKHYNWSVSSKVNNMYRKLNVPSDGRMRIGWGLNSFPNRFASALKGLAKMNLIDMRRNPNSPKRYQIRIPSWDEIRERGLEADVMSEMF